MTVCIVAPASTTTEAAMTMTPSATVAHAAPPATSTIVVETPELSYHDDIKPVLAVDLHPNSSRMATGGADHMVRVWQLATRSVDAANNNATTATASDAAAAPSTGAAAVATPLLSGRTELTFLANLAFHEAPVNAVRFSPDGKLLASASDDHWVVIWKRLDDAIDAAPAAAAVATSADGSASASIDLTGASPSPPAAAASVPAPISIPVASPATPFGVDAEDVIESKEKWVAVNKFRGHVADIYDMCWSPNSTELISGSIDHHTLVWSLATNTFTQTLKDHAGYVQGVCWDPLNQFIATQSSDRSVKVYERKRNAKSKANKPMIEFVEKCTIKNRKTPRVAGSKEDAPVVAGEGPTPKKKLQPMSLVLDSPIAVDAMDTDQENQPPVHVNIATTAGDAAAAAAAAAGTKIDLSSTPKKDAKAPSTTITRHMFTDDAHPSYFRRLCFSPDGSFLLAPAGQFHADEIGAEEMPGTNLMTKLKTEMNPAVTVVDGASTAEARSSSLPTCYLFHRSDFSRPICHLPQLDPVVVVKFNPKLWQKRGNGEDESMKDESEERTSLPYRMVFAVATTKHILIYDTESAYPLAIIKNIHHSGLTDLAWSADGATLISSSRDGYCSYVYLTQEKPEIGNMLSEEEMSSYRAWWSTRRDQISASIMSDAPSKSTVDKKKKKIAPEGEAKTAIVALLGAEPAPLPTLEMNADGTPNTATTAAAGTVATPKVVKATKMKRTDSELYEHAMELLKNGEKLTATRMQNDAGTGPDRIKRIIEGIDALLLRGLGKAFAAAAVEAAVANELDFGDCLAFEFDVAVGSDMKEAKGRKPDAPVAYSMQNICIKEKKPRAPKKTIAPGEVPAELDALALSSSINSAAPAAASSSATATSAPAATPASPVPAAIGATLESQPIVIDAPEVSATPISAATSSPTKIAAAHIPTNTTAAAVTPIVAAVAPSTPLKAVGVTSASKKSPATAAASSGSSNGKKKRKSHEATDAKPKNSIMDMFRKATSGAKPTSSAKAASSSSRAAASASEIVDLTLPTVKLDEVPVAQPRAKRRITPEAVTDAPKQAATTATAKATPVAVAPIAVAASSIAPAASSSTSVAMDLSHDSDSDAESTNSEQEYVVERILKKRSTPSNGVEYLIKWANYDASANNWEPVENLSCAAEIARFEKAQAAEKAKPKKRVTPTLISGAAAGVAVQQIVAAASASSSESTSNAAAAVSTSSSSSSSVPVDPFVSSMQSGVSVASLSPSRKRKSASENEVSTAVSPSAPSSSITTATSSPMSDVEPMVDAASSTTAAVAVTSSQLSSSEQVADAGVHQPEVKKKRKITPQPVQ